MSMIAHFVRGSPRINWPVCYAILPPLKVSSISNPRRWQGAMNLFSAGLRCPRQRANGARRSPHAGATVRAKGQGAALSIDKSWHGIHYLLCGAVEPTSTLVSKTIMGGTEVGDDFSGYGPARYFAVKETAAISAELNRGNLEAEMTRRFDPAQMTKLGIYPNGWSGPDAQWLLREFRNLRAFYADASAKGFAMVTCLV